MCSSDLDEGDYVADCGSQQGGNHQDAEPAYIEAVVGAGDPVAKLRPQIGAFALL